jgi:hypothetical protein
MFILEAVLATKHDGAPSSDRPSTLLKKVGGQLRACVMDR